MTSANVVGYQNVATKVGFTYLAPTFQKVDGSSLTFNDIIPVGDDAGYGAEAIQVFDQDNYVGGFYTYLIEDAGAPDGDGWYDENNEKVAPELGVGVGVLFQSEGATVQFAGQVAEGDVEITEINAGFTYISNPLPVKRSIQDFVPTGDNAGYGAEAIQTFDQDNYVGGFFTYLIEDAGAPDGDGWYDENNEKAVLDFEPGMGFLFQSEGDCTLKVTKVL